MTWTVILDPPAIAAGAPVYRVPLELNNGPIRVDQKGLDWGDSQIQTYLADRRVGSIKIDFRMPNRKITIPLFLMDDDTPGGTGLTEEQGREMLQEKVGLLQMRGGWIMRQRAGGDPTYADVVDAVLTLPDVWGETGGVEPNVNLILECSPDFYGDEIGLDIATVTKGVLTGPITEGGTPAVISGDHQGRATIRVTDLSGTDQLSLIWAFRTTFYDPAATAALVYPAENLAPIGPATVTTIAGVTGVQHSSLSASTWSPILQTNIGGISPLTHIGSYRIRARVYTSSATSVWLRLVWGVGAAVGTITNSFVLLPGANNFYIVDLGEIRVDYPPIGPTRWEGQFQGQGQGGGENVFIDQIYLQPLDDAAGYVIANPSVVTLSSPVAADFFNQSPGDLNGKTAPQGGNWIEPVLGVSTPPDGPLDPGATANHSGAGTQAWDSLTTTSAEIASLAVSTLSQYLQVGNFGFTVPSGATITGVQVSFEHLCSSGGPVVDGSTTNGGHPGVILQNGGTTLGSDKSSTTHWPSTDTLVTYGGSSDLWGATLTPAIVNSSGFGFFLAVFNLAGGATANPSVDNISMTIYYTVATGSGNFQVGSGAVVRSLGDTGNHFAVLGIAVANTDVSADIGLASYPLSANAGLVARYVDPNNYLGVHLTGLGSGTAQVDLIKWVAGAGTALFSTVLSSVPPVLPTLFNLRLVVNAIGLAQVFLNGALLGSGTNFDLAAGGALATGRAGLFQAPNFASVETHWDNFAVYDSSNTDAVMFADASADLRYDGMYRSDPSGVYYGPISQVVGDLPRLPPSGIEAKSTELFLLVSQGDLHAKPDLALGSFIAQVTYRPVRIHRA